MSLSLAVQQSQAEGVPASTLQVLQPELGQHRYPRVLPATPGEPVGLGITITNVSEIVLWGSVHKSCTQRPKGKSSILPTDSLTF